MLLEKVNICIKATSIKNRSLEVCVCVIPKDSLANTSPPKPSFSMTWTMYRIVLCGCHRLYFHLKLLDQQSFPNCSVVKKNTEQLAKLQILSFCVIVLPKEGWTGSRCQSFFMAVPKVIKDTFLGHTTKM